MNVLFDKSNLQLAAIVIRLLEQGRTKIWDDGKDALTPLNDLLLALLSYDDIFSIKNSVTHPCTFRTSLPISEIDLDLKHVAQIVQYVNEDLQPCDYLRDIDSSGIESFDDLEEIMAYQRKYLADKKYYGYGSLTLETPGNCRTSLAAYLRNNAMDSTDRISIGAIEYCIIAHQLMCTYFPSPARLEYLNEYYNFERASLGITRIMANHIDKAALELYEEINIKLGSPYLVFKMPLLLDYVYSCSSHNIIKTALQLRDTPELRNFRKWMVFLEESVQTGNWTEVNHSLSLIDDIFEDTKKVDKHIDRTMELTLTWYPAVNIPFAIKHDANKTRRLGCVFVRDMASYALKRRPLSKY